MICPKCSSGTRTKDSRTADEGHHRKRTRVCKGCGHTFKTVEHLDAEGGQAEWATPACAACGAAGAVLVENHLTSDGVSLQRIYRCESCGNHTYTVESLGTGTKDSLPLRGPLVVSGSGRRIPYDRNRLMDGLAHLRGPHLAEDAFRQLIDHVEEVVTPVSVVDASEIEDRILGFLRKTSRMAYCHHLLKSGKPIGIKDLREEPDNGDE